MAAAPETWKKLQAHYDEKMLSVQMRDLFDSDPARFAKFSATFHDILLDYSKNIITEETMTLLEHSKEVIAVGFGGSLCASIA